MGENNRRPHIGLKPRRYKKGPFIPPDDEDEEEGYEEEFVGSDINELRKEAALVLENKRNLEQKNNIRIEDNLYFLLKLYDKIYWKSTHDRLENIPIKINEIIDDYTIKVKLNRKEYDDFYFLLDELNDVIKEI